MVNDYSITEVWLYYNKKILKKKKKKTDHSLLKRLIKFDIVYVWIALKRKKKKKIAFDVHGSHKYEKTQIYL